MACAVLVATAAGTRLPVESPVLSFVHVEKPVHPE